MDNKQRNFESASNEIKKYQNVYRENKGDIAGFVANRSKPQTKELSSEQRQWSTYFDELNAGVDHNANRMKQIQSVLPPALTSINKLEGSQLMNLPPVVTQADINREKRAAIKPSNPFTAAIKSVADPVAEGIDWLMYGNPVGEFVTRAGHTAASMTGPAVTVKPETGSKVADVAADVLGGISGFAANPATGNLPGTNLLSGPYKQADALMRTGAGQKVTQALANQAGKVVNPQLAQKIADTAVRGGIAGAGQNVLQSGMRGETDVGDLVASAAIGAGLGAAGDVLFQGLGKGAQALMKRVAPQKKVPSITEAPAPLKQAESNVSNVLADAPTPKHSLQEQINASIEELSNPLGISAFGKAKTPYERASLESTLSQIRSRTQKDFGLDSLKEKGHRIYQDFVDDVHSFNRFDKYAEQVLGRELRAAEKVHTAALNSRGADMIASQIVKNGLVNKSGEVVGRSLKDRLAALPLNKYAEFEDYLVNRHAITRFERGETVYDKRLNWTPEQGQQNITKYEAEYPQFKQIADDIYDYQKAMVNEWLVNTGMITKEQAESWFKANPFYVPNKRYFSELEKGGNGYGSKSGYANQSVPVKKANKHGSQRQIISPIESIIENTDAYVKSAKRNEVMQNFVHKLNQNPKEFADWAEIVQGPKDNRNIKHLFGEELENALDDIAKDYEKTINRKRLDTDDVVRVLVNGEPVHVQIKDKDLLQAAMALGPENSAKLLEWTGKLTNMFKTFTTGINPYFVVRNVTRDLGDAWINSKSSNNPLSFLQDFLKASFDIIRGNKGKAWQEYMNVGGGHTSQVASRNMLSRSKQAILPQTPVQKIKGAPRQLWRTLEDILSATESMGRLAEFKRLQGNRTPDELAKALYEAQEVAINFKRRGAITKEIDKVIPYFNAAVQGLDRFARAFKDNPVKASVKAVLAMTVPTAALYALNKDNPRYQELPENTKDNFFLIPTDGGEKFIKIAKPRELGTLFSSIPERLMRQFADEDPEAWNEFAQHMVKTFTLPGIEGALTAKGGATEKVVGALRSTIGGPFMDLALNENFAGAPIIPGYLERLSPDLQYDEKTSTLARRLAENMGGSPMKYDYVMKQYLGGLGKAILPGATPSGNPITELGAQFTADPVYSNQLSNKFYDVKGKLDQAHADRNVRGKLPEWYNDGVRKRMNKLSESMSDTRKKMKAIETDVTIDKTEKEKQLRELREKINQYARDGMDLVKKKELKIPD